MDVEDKDDFLREIDELLGDNEVAKVPEANGGGAVFGLDDPDVNLDDPVDELPDPNTTTRPPLALANTSPPREQSPPKTKYVNTLIIS